MCIMELEQVTERHGYELGLRSSQIGLTGFI